MQKTLTPQHPSENDCFARDTVKDAEETDIPLSSVSIGGLPLCNLRFADDIDLLGCSEEELQQLSERSDKTAAGYGTEISSDKSKIHDHSIKLRPSSMDEWKNAAKSGPAQKRIHINQRRNIITTYCIRSAFTQLWLWRKLYDCLLHHFITSKCILKCALLLVTLSSTSNRLAEI